MGVYKYIKKIPSKFYLLFVYFYQKVLGPHIGECCRFHPSCSSYSIEVIKKYGFLKGVWYTFKRLIKCHPWGKL